MADKTEPEFEAPIDIDALGWDAPEPPNGFATRVVAAMDEDVAEAERPHAERRARPVWIAGVAGLAAVAVLWLFSARLFGGADPVRDSLTARGIETVHIHDRAIAVAQPGARVRWEVDGDGTARVEQEAGRVFYRVDDGRPFEVRTPAGTVKVTGTCFEVELTSPMDGPMKKQGLKAGALGAALASAVFVTVYEGQVVLANERGEMTVDPGQRARSSGDGAPTRWGDDEANGGSGEHDKGSAPAIPAGTDPIATLRRQAQDLERLRAEKLAQTEQLEGLRAQVEALGGTPEGLGPQALKAKAKKCAGQSRNGDCPFLEPDQDTLDEMARCATVKYDYPSFLEEIDPPQAQGYAQQLGLDDPAEIEAFQSAADKHHARYNEQLRALYVELGGDPDLAEESSANALTGFIEDQLDRDLVADIQRRVAEERAGMREPPAHDAEMPLEERFWRLRAEMGNDFEEHVAESLGPDRARELRRANDGWPGSTSVHSSDCE